MKVDDVWRRWHLSVQWRCKSEVTRNPVVVAPVWRSRCRIFGLNWQVRRKSRPNKRRTYALVLHCYTDPSALGSNAARSEVPLPCGFMLTVSALRPRPSICSYIQSSRCTASAFTVRISHHTSRPRCVSVLRQRTMATNAAPALRPQAVEEEAQHLSNGDVKVNNWSRPGPAAFDFRSQ